MQSVPCLESLKDWLGFLVTIILGDDSLIQPKTSRTCLEKGHYDVTLLRGGSGKMTTPLGILGLNFVLFVYAM